MKGQECSANGNEEAEAALEAALLHLETSGTSTDDLSWWHQLKTLVQAGVPMVCCTPNEDVPAIIL